MQRFDDMRGVFSYDIIIDSIKIILGRGHVDLIETLASGIADEILRYPCVARVSVRIEKLDVVRGTVGIEIKRERAANEARERRVGLICRAIPRNETAVRVTIVKFGGSLAQTPHCAAWLEVLAAWRGPLIVVPGGGPFADAVRAAQAAMGFDDAVAHRMALLAMEQFAVALAAHAMGFALAASRDELDSAFAPDENSRLAAGKNGAGRAGGAAELGHDLGFARGLARRGLWRRRLLLIKSRDPEPPVSVKALAEDKIVDPLFPHYAAQSRAEVWLAGPASLPGAASILQRGGMPGIKLAVP